MNKNLVFAELDNLLESAMKETIRGTILESALPDSQKVNSLSGVENASFSKEQILEFTKETVKPIIEASGLSNFEKWTYNPNKKNIRSVPLPVYEIAMTLESARLGQLTEDSLDTVYVPNTIDQAIGDTDPGDVVDTEEISQQTDLSELPKEEGKAVSEADISVTDDGETGSVNDLTDVEQYDENEMQTLDNSSDEEKNVAEHVIIDRFGRKIVVEADENTAETGGEDVRAAGDKIESAEYHDPDPVEAEFTSDSDIEPYDPGKPSTGADQGLFKPYTEAKSLRAFLKYLNEEGDLDLTNTTDEEEVEQTSDEALKTYAGDEAGEPSTADTDQFAQTDIQAVQEKFARIIIGQIFKEYGITHKGIKKAMICEAVHYLTNYGVNSLYPSISDIATAVTEQSKAFEADKGVHPVDICEGTNFKYLSEVLSSKLNKQWIANAKDKKFKRVVKKVGKAKPIIKKIGKKIELESTYADIANTLAKNLEVERQIFRSRMSFFDEGVKTYITSRWNFVETAQSQAAVDMVPLVTVKRYVTEGNDMREFFEVVGKDSPVYKPVFFKETTNNDSLVVASLMLECACECKEIADMCVGEKNVTKLTECQTAAKKAMLENVIAHVNLCADLKQPDVAITQIREMATKVHSGILL